MTEKTQEQWLLAFHAYPTDAHDIESLRRFLAYFREREEQHASDGNEGNRQNMRAFQRQTETAIARHDSATPDDLANLRLV